MQRWMLKSKIHRATVTRADLDYEGSIEIDGELLAAADIVPFEMVKVWNVTTGDRFETYAMPGERGSGTICVNGAAAHRASKGDLVIIASFVAIEEKDVAQHEPRLVFVNERNKVVELTCQRPRKRHAC